MKGRKSFTLSELIVFLFVFSLLGIFIFSVLQNFFSGTQKNEKIQNFSNIYNEMIENFYINGYNKWNFYTGYDNRVVLYNSGNILGYSGYMGYECGEEGVGMTYVYSGYKIKDRNYYQKNFTGFSCHELSSRKAQGGYRLEFEIELLSRKMNLKHFISTE